MKRITLYSILVSIAALSIAATTPSVRVSLTDQQTDELKFLRSCYGETNTPLSQFITNHTELVSGIVWSTQAKQLLEARKHRAIEAVYSATDDQIAAIERVLGLIPITIDIGAEK